MKLFRNPPKDQWDEIVRRPAARASDMMAAVRSIFDEVRTSGDAALLAYAREFDGVDLDAVRVTLSEIEEQAAKVPGELRDAIEVARRNIALFHESQRERTEVVETMPGVECWRRSEPVRRVGLYIPGGTAPLFSTVLMLGVPARIAGCKGIAVTTPPRKEGPIHPAIAYSAQVLDLTEIYQVGGAQAIAALAFGTATIPRVDKIFGPGNQYVMAAKQQASLVGTAIDMPAGPTEVAIIADESCPLEFLVYDILSQAEHGADSHVLFVTTSSTLAERVLKEVDEAVAGLPRGPIASASLQGSSVVVLPSAADCVSLVNQYAPEHLILAHSSAERLHEQVVAAGSVFVGLYSPEAAGDYATGTNHTLPTNGAAVAYSGVSLDSFVKKITFQRLSEAGLRAVGPAVETMAEAEGLEAHRRSVSVRLNYRQSVSQ